MSMLRRATRFVSSITKLPECLLSLQKAEVICTPTVELTGLTEGSQEIISVNVPCEIHSYSEGKANVLVAQWVSDSLQPHGLQPTRLLCPWNSPGKNTEEGSYSLLQGIFPTQGSNQGLLHCRQIHYQVSYQGSPWDSHCFSFCCSNRCVVISSFLK